MVMLGQYEVLSPWAEVEPKSMWGISPRVSDLAGRKIGLFASTHKRAALPIQRVVERKLKERFPTAEFIYFQDPENRAIVESRDKERFEKWVNEVDAVGAAIGD